MNALIRIALGIALAVVAVAALLFVLKLVFAAAVLAFVALAAVYAYHFVRAFVRRLTASETVSAGPKAMLRG